MKYIVYLTTNIENNKIYVGVHKTENPEEFDGYLGCRVYTTKPSTYNKSKTPFQFAVNKYGAKAFKRSLIKIFDTLEEALFLEAEIVNEQFIKRGDTYNVALGGGLIPLTNKKVYQYSLSGDFVAE
jgi:phage regulator Rha-like protein